MIPHNYFPSYFINLDIDTKLIDINIHPTKTEIKFEDEQAIYAIIRACVKRSLGAYNIAPTIDFSQELSFDLGYKQSKKATIKEPTIKVDLSYNPFKNKIGNQSIQTEEKWGNPSLDEDFVLEDKNTDFQQIGNHFIAVPNENGLLLIDQRRAHKRILFEYFTKVLNSNKGQSQQLLFPKEIELNKSEIGIIIDMTDELNKVGFNFEVKENHISINGIPPECQEENLQFVIEVLIEQHKNSEDLLTEQQNNLAVSLANSLAINEVKKLSSEEMIRLKNELLKCESPSVCPKGKRTMINIKTTDLEKYF